MDDATEERWLRAWHMHPANAKDIEELRRYLKFFRERETAGDELHRALMRNYQRDAEIAIARHSEATEADRSDLRLIR
jgi:hypothetical protein